MKLFTTLCLFIICFSVSTANTPAEIDDSIIHSIFIKYESALKSKDTLLSKNCFVSKSEFQEIIDFVKLNQPNCIGLEEENFTTELNDRAFSSITTNKVIIKQVYVNRIEYNNSCGDLLTIPRVICTIQYNDNKVIEIPFLLIKTMSGKYKILRNFLNIKLFNL